MFDSAILDVAIGLVFIFLLVSLLVSAASEALSGWLKWRSQHLWEGLEQLLQSPDARNELYNHPLVKGLARVDVVRPEWNEGRNGPSYIPSRTFALALIDILRQPHRFVDDLQQRLQSAVDDPLKIFESLERIVQEVSGASIPDKVKAELGELRDRLHQPVDAAVVASLKQKVRGVLDSVPEAERPVIAERVSEWVGQQADAAATYVDLRTTLTAAIRTVPFAGSASTEQVRAALEKVVDQFAYGSPEEAIREIQAFTKEAAKRWLQDASSPFQGTHAALSPLLHDAADDVDRFRENIEIWFNDGMDRVSGWYKRHIAYVQGAIALGLAMVMNIDALQITRTLWREPALRQSLVANAEAFADNPPPSLQYPASETVGQASASTDKVLKARLSTVRLLPDDVATAYITLPEPATDQASLVVERQSVHIFVGETDQEISASRIEVKPTAGATEIPIFLKAGPVTTETRERIKVTAGGQEVLPELVVTPMADQSFAAVQKQIATLGLPIGWSCPVDAAVRGVPNGDSIGGPFWCAPGKSGGTWADRSWWMAVGFKNVLAMIFGWLITAAAASLGAPFWFDTLKRVISVRSSGKAPEERPLSPKEVSQPREPGQRPKEADWVNALKR
ncbi:MAG: hypothetical protein ACREXS_17340 [Gammaproteobacteria bacterium]